MRLFLFTVYSLQVGSGEMNKNSNRTDRIDRIRKTTKKQKTKLCGLCVKPFRPFRAPGFNRFSHPAYPVHPVNFLPNNKTACRFRHAVLRITFNRILLAWLLHEFRGSSNLELFEAVGPVSLTT
jgi:hypothetical protein